jgi:uncharacterized protein (TIRG00374 family)
MKKIIVGILVSAAFVYFSLRGLEFNKLVEGMKGVNYGYLLPVILLTVLIAVLRSLRWGLIISPIKKLGQKELFPMSCIGFMGVVLIPMRMGEFVRPYLLRHKGHVSFSSGLATIFVERVFDVMTVLGIFLIVVLNSDLPPWLLRSGYTAFVGFLGLFGFMLMLYFKTDLTLKILRPALKVLPDGIGTRLEEMFHHFVDGFRVISSPSRLLGTLAYSVGVWLTAGLSIYILFYFQNFELSLLVAFVVLIVNIIGISLPTAPGMLGNFQYGIIVALMMFDITKDEAFLFSMVYYLISIGVITILGIASMPTLDISIKEALKDIKQSVSKDEPGETPGKS